MTTLSTLVDEDTIRSHVRNGLSHQEIADILKSDYLDIRGLSSRSVRRYCRDRGITRITDAEVTFYVNNFVNEYGHLYGRAMMQGSLRWSMQVSHGIVSQRRVSRALRRVAPQAFQARTRDTFERMNPIPYYAPYFGYKAHMDQNEKLGPFGCTHVALIDGCSRMICGFASMPYKNPISIYQHVYKNAVSRFGLWDQLRVDHGQEFSLSIFVQDLLKNYRNQKNREPWRQTASTDNYVIERLWPEINFRINYPVKRCFISITEEDFYDISDPIMKYCVSFVCNYVVYDACQHFINSWNFHRVSGPTGCIPVENMRQTTRSSFVPEYLLPQTDEAVKMYEDLGGNLSRDSVCGSDPLIDNDDAYESRNNLFLANQPTPMSLFSDIINGQNDSVRNAISMYYDLTIDLDR